MLPKDIMYESDAYKDRSWEFVDHNGEEWDKFTFTFRDDLSGDWAGSTVEVLISPKLDEIEFDGVHYTYIYYSM